MISGALAVLESEEQRNELSAIYENNIKQFYSIAISHLHNRQDAEDAIQEAFLSIANNPSKFFEIPTEKRVSYINVVIKNISCGIWNKKQRIEENQAELDEDITDKSISVDEKIISEHSCEEIYRFIDTLSESTKTAIYLRIHMNMKFSDIAQELGISEEAAKKRVLRGANKIKQFMEASSNEQLHN